MGLDMWLRLRHRTDFDKSFETFDNAHGSHWQCKEKIYDVQYWRKANAVHKWFVDNVQDGNDDCGHYSVTLDHLHKLRADCDTALDHYNEGDHEGAAQFMPTASGFFFGCTDYDDYYAEDLHKTSVACSKLIKTIQSRSGGGWLTVEYESSW